MSTIIERLNKGQRNGLVGLDGNGNLPPAVQSPSQPPRIHTVIGATPDQLQGGFPTKNAGVSTPALSAEQAFTYNETIKFTVSASGTQGLYWLNGPKPSFDADGTTPIQTAMPIKKFSEIGMRFYVDDVSDLTSISLQIYTDSGKTAPLRWIRSTAGTDQPALQNGWNVYRFPAEQGVTTNWDESIYRIDVLCVCSGTGPINIYLDQVWGVERPKASIIFVTDLALRYFLEGVDGSGVTGGYPDLHARGLPCVFATQPRHWDGGATRPTTAQIQQVANENGNEISFHSFGGEGASISALSEAEIKSYASKAIRRMKEAGIKWFPWRAAWLGNNEPAFTASDDLLEGMFYAIATADGDAANLTDPPYRLQDVARIAIHNRTETELNNFFAALDKFKPLTVHYTHYISDDFAVNMAPARWEQYLSLVDSRIAAGTLELITMETVFRRAGGTFENGAGGGYWRWTDSLGVEHRIQA